MKEKNKYNKKKKTKFIKYLTTMTKGKWRKICETIN